MLLNSVGTVILQVQRHFDISKADASILEGFKDIPIAIASFLFASFLPRIGLKRSMLIGLGIVTVSTFILPFIGAFWYFKVLFFSIGVSFAIIKISTFAAIGITSDTEKKHASTMSYIEGIFMAGILCGQFLMSFLVDNNNPKSALWLNAYWILSLISLIAFVLLWFAELNEAGTRLEEKKLGEDFKEMLRLMILPLSIVFIISIFCYVLIEQSFQTWFPTFYRDILKTPASMAIQSGAILAGASMIGRLLSGFVLSKLKWLWLLTTCILSVIILVVLVLPLAENNHGYVTTSWLHAMPAAYVLPLMGFFLAPVYPTLNSVILSSLPTHKHSAMSGLIVVFSALGGTTGSIITGHIFERFDGITAFHATILPLSLMIVLFFILAKWIKKPGVQN